MAQEIMCWIGQCHNLMWDIRWIADHNSHCTLLYGLQQPQQRNVTNGEQRLHCPFHHLARFLSSGAQFNATVNPHCNNNLLLFHIYHRRKGIRRKRPCTTLLILWSNNVLKTRYFPLRTPLRLRWLIFKEHHWHLTKRLTDTCKRIRSHIQIHILPIPVHLNHLSSPCSRVCYAKHFHYSQEPFPARHMKPPSF